MLKVKNIQVLVEGKEILSDVSMDLKPGEVVVVMGKNGSGKSTLANTLMGHPKYVISNLKFKISNEKPLIELDGVDITDLTPDKRANLGLFLANQYPMAVSGLIVNSFLWQIYKKQIKNYELRITNIIEFRKWLEQQAKLLDLNPELLKRGLNDGFSGGEKKKLEVLQMLVFNPKYVILDEIDSGLDVDALKKIAVTVAMVAKEKKIGVLIITHYSRILKYLKPDRVIVMENGKIVEEGGSELATKIEERGFGDEEK